ncbi:MAG: response regulator transcription factor [Planctomycetota bacterium]
MSRWILVVEDEAALGGMICDNLRADGYGVELIGTGDQAAARLETGRFDLVLLDVMLPGQDGLSVLQAMRTRGDRTPVLMLSAKGADEDRIRGLEAQADDYLAKPFHLRELLLRVAALLRRAPAGESATDELAFGGNTIDFRAQTARTWNGECVELTGSEATLLRLLGSRRGELVSRREAVEALFGPATPPTARTVDNVIVGLRKRFERDRNAPRWLVTVRGRGWRLVHQVPVAREERDAGGA